MAIHFFRTCCRRGAANWLSLSEKRHYWLPKLFPSIRSAIPEMLNRVSVLSIINLVLGIGGLRNATLRISKGASVPSIKNAANYVALGLKARDIFDSRSDSGGSSRNRSNASNRRKSSKSSKSSKSRKSSKNSKSSTLGKSSTSSMKRNSTKTRKSESNSKRKQRYKK